MPVYDAKSMNGLISPEDTIGEPYVDAVHKILLSIRRDHCSECRAVLQYVRVHDENCRTLSYYPQSIRPFSWRTCSSPLVDTMPISTNTKWWRSSTLNIAMFLNLPSFPEQTTTALLPSVHSPLPFSLSSLRVIASILLSHSLSTKTTVHIFSVPFQNIIHYSGFGLHTLNTKSTTAAISPGWLNSTQSFPYEYPIAPFSNNSFKFNENVVFILLSR